MSSAGSSGILKGSATNANGTGTGTLKTSGGTSWSLPDTAKQVTGNGGLLARSNAVKAAYQGSGNLWDFDEETPAKNNGWDVPRREAIPGFTGIYTPDSSGMIKEYLGGKLVNGVIRYPEGVNVDRTKAAKAQAFMDWSYGETGTGNPEMAALYGEDYTKELQRLASLRGEDPFGPGSVGGSGWGGSGISSGYGAVSDRDTNGIYNAGNGSFDFGGGGYTDYLSDYEAAIQAARDASASALQQQIQAGLNTLGSQKDEAYNNYDRAAQEAYIAMMQSRKNLPQSLAAMGLNGGASESSNLALETNYGDNLNQLQRSLDSGITSIDQSIANAIASGNASLAQNDANYNSQLANGVLSAGQQAASLQAQQQLALLQAQIQAQQNAANQANQLKLAELQRQWANEDALTRNNTEYDTWLKKFQVQQQADLDQWNREQAAKAAAAAAQYSYGGGSSAGAGYSGSTGGTSENLFGSGTASSEQALYDSIINSTMTDQEKKRRLQSLGLSWGF